MRIGAAPLLLCVTVALTGCGSGSQGLAGDPLASSLIGRIGGLFGGGEAPVDARAVLTRDLIETADRPYLLIGQEQADVWFTALAVGENRGYVSYQAGDGTGVILNDGLLTGTRGLGFDLHTVDAGDARDQIFGGGDTTTERVHRIIDGNDAIVAERFLCAWQQAGLETLTIYERSYPTRRVVETCRSAETEFENTYWVGANGVVRQSRQHVSDQIGSLFVQQLVP